MSRKQRIKHMSSDELKTKLYSHFQKSGSLDHLKAQLRGQLVSELFKIAEPVDSDKFPNVCDTEKCVLPIQVCNWLVFDHLTRQNYQYSLSTFVSEAQLPYPEKFLTAGDVLHLLGLKNTADCENISKLYSINNELGFLHSLLLAIIKTMFHVSNKDLPSDTSHEGAEAVTSENRLQNGYKESTQNFAQSKPEAFANTSFQDLSQLKQVSLNKSFFTNDDEKSAEASFLKEMQSFKEENEKEVQRMRHRLLDELDNLHSQKRKMQLELEQTKSEFKKEQNRLLKEKEMLKEKEVLLEKELTNQFEMNMRSLESEFAEKLHFKEKEIESLNRKLSEKDEKLEYSEAELASEKDNNNHMKEELRHLKYEYKSLEDKYSALLDQNTSLLKKYRNMSDYSQIKEELSDKAREFTRLQNETKDLHQKSEAERRKYVEAVRNLESNLNMKEQELMQAREEIDEARNNLKREQAVWNKERRKYEHELREMKDYYDTLMQTLEERNEELEDLRQTNQILNHKLANRVISAAKSEYVGLYKMHHLPLSNQKSNTGMLFTKRNTFLPQSEKEYDSKFKFFSDKKSTFGTLKQEENKVQEKYSIIYSTMPEYNKSISYPRSCNFLPLPKKSADSYSTFSKTAFTTPTFNYDKSKLSTVTKSPYSLSDVRQMVTHTLSPNKAGKYTDFQTNTSSFASTSQMPNISDTRVKDIWTAPESSGYYNFHKQYGLTGANDNTSTLSTMRHSSSLTKDNITSENPLHLSSVDKNNGENHKITLNSKEFNKEVTIDNDSSDKLEEDGVRAKSLRKNCLEANTNEGSSDVNTDIASTIPGNSEAISEQENVSSKNRTITTQVQSALNDSTKDIHNVTSKTVGNKPESTFSVFINLDDAWKKRSSVTSLSYKKDIIDETNSKDRPDSSLYPSSVVSNNTNIFSAKPHTFDGSLGKLNKIDSEDVFDKSPENGNNVSLKGNTKGSSHLQQNTSKQIDSSVIEREPSLYDKSMRNLDNDKIDSEDVFNKSAENVGYDSAKGGTISTSHSQQDRSKQTGDSLNVERELSLCDKSFTDTDKTKYDIGGASNELQTLDKETNNVVVDRELPLREGKQMSHSYEEINKEEEKTKKSEEEDNGKSSVKTGNTDSLSEQSELHLSCGSEAEQQKEDSDAW